MSTTTQTTTRTTALRPGRGALARSQQGRPTAQVQRMLQNRLTPLGVRLSTAILHKLAVDITARRPVELP